MINIKFKVSKKKILMKIKRKDFKQLKNLEEFDVAETLLGVLNSHNFSRKCYLKIEK